MLFLIAGHYYAVVCILVYVSYTYLFFAAIPTSTVMSREVKLTNSDLSTRKPAAFCCAADAPDQSHMMFGQGSWVETITKYSVDGVVANCTANFMSTFRLGYPI